MAGSGGAGGCCSNATASPSACTTRFVEPGVIEEWYRHHVETVYCLEGSGRLENRETGEVFELEPGTLYVLDGHERHTVRATTRMRMLCIFTPPVTGDEVHDEHGGFAPG